MWFPFKPAWIPKVVHEKHIYVLKGKGEPKVQSTAARPSATSIQEQRERVDNQQPKYFKQTDRHVKNYLIFRFCINYLQPNRSSFTSSEQVLTNKNGVSFFHCLHKPQQDTLISWETMRLKETILSCNHIFLSNLRMHNKNLYFDFVDVECLDYPLGC